MCPAVGGAVYVGGGTHGCRPTGDMKVQCISMKLSFRGAKRRGNPYSPHGRKCGAGEYGLPHRRARRFAMTVFAGEAHDRAAGCGHPAARYYPYLSSFIFSPALGRSPSPAKTPRGTLPLRTRLRGGSGGTTPSDPRRSTRRSGSPPAPPRRRSSFSAAWP